MIFFTIKKFLRGGRIFAALFALVCRAGISAPDVPTAFSEALKEYQANNFSAARERFARIAAVKPDDPNVGLYLGRIAWWFDENQESVRLLENAARNAPGNGRIQSALGDAYGCMALESGLFSKFGWAKKCQAAHELAVRLAPEDVSCLWGLFGYFCLAPRFAGGGFDKALAEAKMIRTISTIDGRIAFETLYLFEKKNDLAFAQFREVLNTAPDDYLSLYHFGRCASLSGEQLDRGASALRRCLQLPLPDDSNLPSKACVHFRLGNILEKQGDQVAAEIEFEAALRVQPDFRSEKITLKN